MTRHHSQDLLSYFALLTKYSVYSAVGTIYSYAEVVYSDTVGAISQNLIGGMGNE